MKTVVAILALGALAAVPFVRPLAAAAAQSGAGKSITVPAVAVAPKVDGTLNDAAWQKGAKVVLSYDLQNHRPATTQTMAYVLTDGKYLYVGWQATQSVPVVVTQHTNDAGLGGDDRLGITLWPGGVNGFQYQFNANAIGTHDQSSSENTAFAPTWQSAGTAGKGQNGDDTYTVTMKIPLDVMRGATSSSPWRAQFVRIVESTGEEDVWTWDPTQTNANSVAYAGTLDGMPAIAALRPRPRLQIYGLGMAAGKSVGGGTSRMGADFSIPFTPTTSLVGTVHPDYSDVEVDQQTISPTAFQRSFQEVRPFFTQLQQSFNPLGCNVCNFVTPLYTPAIPTPRDGYALEGKQGPLGFAAFDSLSAGRSDSASVLSYVSPNQRFTTFAQRVAVDMTGFRDDTTTTGASYNDNKHWYGYTLYSNDEGTGVPLGNQSSQYEAGVSWSDPTTVFATAIRKIGEFYQPADGFVTNPGIAGYGGYFGKSFLQDKPHRAKSISVDYFWDRYHALDGQLNQTDNQFTFDVLTRSLFDVDVNVGSSYLLLPNGIFSPISQNGVQLTWHAGSATGSNNPGGQHGLSATPTQISFNSGRFGPGKLDSWFRSSTMRVGNRGLLTFEADDTIQSLDAGGRYVQWLERASYAYQAGRGASLAVGIRRTIGTPPYLEQGVCTVSVTQFPGCYQNGWNLSFAYHIRRPQDEFYAVYGDANAFSTAPQFIVKWIHYIGATKGT